MKQLVIISGKGGTGKTVVTAAFASLCQSKVMVDCDVDAADLHLLLKPESTEEHDFKSGKTAEIDTSLCTQCGKCIQACRFGAIKDDFIVEDFSCEGCGLCARICPAGAIRMRENIAGKWFVSQTRFGTLVHAKLGIAQENSGKLVSKIRQEAKERAEKEKSECVIIDGPPGIGCPVIASLSGVDCCLVVTEPTLSGLHDARRVIEVAAHFKVPAKLLINKYDLNQDVSSQIEQYCRSADIELVAKIPFDESVVKAVVSGKTMIEAASSRVKAELQKAWAACSVF
jgi:MinD superfamily P-loop ATPase